MNKLIEKAWLIKQRVAFLLTPIQKRVRLRLRTDGRHITFLLVSLYEKGYAIHVVESPMVFRELLELRKFAPLPFTYSAPSKKCNLAICDSPAALDEGNEPHKILLDYDFFTRESMNLRMPYFMHPNVYKSGLHLTSPPDLSKKRPMRLAFFGTRDADFYTRNFNFPILNREQILETFFDTFEDRIWIVDKPTKLWESRDIAISIDDRGGDSPDKSFLTQFDYIRALKLCDFLLCPPGWCMPLSHSMIESMSMGTIPIINCPEFFDPPLEDQKNCIVFTSQDSLKNQISSILELSFQSVKRMRCNVVEYYHHFLRPGEWVENMLKEKKKFTRILVNAEEHSV